MLFLKRLGLQNLRLYDEQTLECSPQVNFLHGANAQGKTSVLEGIYCLISGRSFRTGRMQELIQEGKSFLHIEAEFEKNGTAHTLSFGSDGSIRKVSLNGTPLKSIGELIGLIPGVVIAPDDPLVSGSPHHRRHYLDLLLAQSDPQYTHHLSRYHRALRHRNQLLKSKSTETLGIWEAEMAEAAVYLISQRKQASIDIQERFVRLYPLLSGEHLECSLRYSSRYKADSLYESLTEHWQHSRDRDLVLGYTTSGPHRDDLGIFFFDRPVKDFGSEGQKRTVVAALRLAAWERLKEKLHLAPLLLLDDLGASLDSTRRKRLLDHLHGMGQGFLTSTESPEAPLISENSKQYVVCNGNISSL